MVEYDSGFKQKGAGGDLLSKIAAGDEQAAAAAQKKKEHSILMSAMVLIMEWTFLIDDAKRKNKALFTALATCWGVFMGVLYASAVCMSILLVVVYQQLPNMVKDTLIANNIQLKNYKIDDYSLSQIIMTNLEDKNGTYSIKKLRVISSFADLIHKHVKSVDLDGVTLKVSEDKNGFNVGALPMTLLQMKQKDSVHIDNISLTNASLEINGTGYKIPVTFTLTGVYEKDAKISIPSFTIKDSVFNVQGSLDVVNTKKKSEIVLKILRGNITLPQRSPETVAGTVTFTLDNMDLTNVTGNVSLTYGKDVRTFSLDMKGGKKKFSGTLGVSVTNANNPDEAVSTDISASFTDLKAESFLKWQVNKPLQLTVKSFSNRYADISNMAATLNGYLSCDHLNCTYQITKKSPVTIGTFESWMYSNRIKSDHDTSFSLLPNTGNTIELKDNALSYNLNAHSFMFSGFQNLESNLVSLRDGTVDVKGRYNLLSGQVDSLSVNAQNMRLMFPEFNATSFSYSNENLMLENAIVQMSGREISLNNNELIKKPFNLQMRKQGSNAIMRLGLAGNMVQVDFAGRVNLMSGDYTGMIYVPFVDLAKLQVPLDEISSLFPELENISGKAGVFGEVRWNGNNQVSGPMQVVLQDVSFKVGDYAVTGLNTVMKLNRANPFETAGPQKIYVADITDGISIRDLNAYLNAKGAITTISDIHADVAGISVISDPNVFTVRKDMTVSLKNPSIDLAEFSQYLQSEGLKLTGQAAFTMPFERKDGILTLGRSELKGAKVMIDLSQAKQDVKSLFGSANRYNVKAGSIAVDYKESNIPDLVISADGRTLPDNQLKSIRRTVRYSLDNLMKAKTLQGVPLAIVNAQKEFEARKGIFSGIN